MYVAVKGGERAIEQAHRLLAQKRRGSTDIAELSTQQIAEQMSFAVSRVMAEGSLYDRDLAALAIKQSQGDLIEAIFLMRAYRTTLPRFAVSQPVDTRKMLMTRRISATFKDVPGGQILGPTYDYTHRLLDFSLAGEETQSQADLSGLADPQSAEQPEISVKKPDADQPIPRVLDDLLHSEGLVQQEDPGAESDPVGDITREDVAFPVNRDMRLQSLSRADEGFLLSLGYSTQRGYGRNHAFVGELRIGKVAVEIEVDGLDFALDIGDIEITECETVNQFAGSKTAPPQFTRGYGLVFGQAERKAISMALVDRALRAAELGEEIEGPAQDEEFVLSHADNIQATGFVEHIKLPHYVDFQSELDLVRRMRQEQAGEQ